LKRIIIFCIRRTFFLAPHETINFSVLAMQENVYDIIQKIFSEKLKLQNIDVKVAHKIGPVKKLIELQTRQEL